jgi:RimJ/RimL family protein N-acetyltransferase
LTFGHLPPDCFHHEAGVYLGPFETDRLYLRQMETADTESLHALIYSDQEVWWQYSGLRKNLPELESRFIYHSHRPKNDSFGRLVVVLKETKQVIGQVHLDPYVNDSGAVPGDSSENHKPKAFTHIYSAIEATEPTRITSYF